MIKVYFDWNVISQMKNGSLDELKKVVFKNDRFLIPFSTSHIGDISASHTGEQRQTENIKSDLSFISELTHESCLFNSNGEIILDNYSPVDLFKQRIDDRNALLENPFDFLADESAKLGIPNPFNVIRNIPLTGILGQSAGAPESTQQLYELFPRLKDNLTFGGLLDAIVEMQKSLNEGDGYKNLRQLVQSGLNIKRDKIYNDDNPYKIIEKSHNATNANLTDFLNEQTNDRNAPLWFNKITNEYILLDMHGYQEDKVNIHKGRKETFRNTTEDAFHAAFASMCNFYITNDNRSYNKTKRVYEKLSINTIVLKSDEFIDYHHKFIEHDNSIKMKAVFWLLENGEFIKETLENNDSLEVCYFPFYLFDFFNKLMIVTADSGRYNIILSQYIPSNGKIYLTEIQRLVEEICRELGLDVDSIGDVQEDEFGDEDNWIGRKWVSDDFEFKLIRLNRRFQLYINHIK